MGQNSYKKAFLFKKTVVFAFAKYFTFVYENSAYFGENVYKNTILQNRYNVLQHKSDFAGNYL